MSRTVPIAERLARNASRSQAAYAELTKALAAGNTAARERAQEKIAELTAEYQRLTEALRFSELEAREIATPRARKPGKPLRELALDALDDLGVPAAPALIADLAAALTGVRPSPSRFASLRRDEENAARRNIAARPAWVVPAISAQQLTAIPRLLSSSSWDLERRIIGARSIRTDNLRIAISLAGRLAHLREVGAGEAKLVERLLFPFARSIPGSIDYGKPIDPARTVDAAQAELMLIEAPDLEERREAAAKLAASGPQIRLWGRPVVIDTAVAERSIR
ncbi:hypothetical protein JHL17_22975 [Azospirillum sp. YIM B02556]|uniref:Uncharacterized protein n=1 Tax=Azospirillum endophyticum TaxID=2800326 RepID=A0ABS1FA27_9PROT|nr:hypothetical protein [Azospirillum endophyticum]MBK1840271.1 hypothetical protein [Azospirillum endophyticum]